MHPSFTNGDNVIHKPVRLLLRFRPETLTQLKTVPSLLIVRKERNIPGVHFSQTLLIYDDRESAILSPSHLQYQWQWNAFHPQEVIEHNEYCCMWFQCAIGDHGSHFRRAHEFLVPNIRAFECVCSLNRLVKRQMISAGFTTSLAWSLIIMHCGTKTGTSGSDMVTTDAGTNEQCRSSHSWLLCSTPLEGWPLGFNIARAGQGVSLIFNSPL